MPGSLADTTAMVRDWSGTLPTYPYIQIFHSLCYLRFFPMENQYPGKYYYTLGKPGEFVKIT